jgi:ABC-2 type transport system ATP-binding protein
MIIETNELRKSYAVRAGRTRTVVNAVDGIDLRVKEGEIFGLLGPNGAGKTTTLHMLATLIEADSGDATVAGADLRTEPHEVRRRLGYVGQRGGTTDDVSAREELILQGRLYGLSKAEATRRASAAIADFALTEYADRRCRTYSGGQRRRVDIAMGVIHRPTVVMLDEPSAGLDPASRAVLWEQIRRLRDSGTTVIITTHYLDEADALCDRLSIIDHGTIVAEGTPAELKSQVAGDVVTLRIAPADARETDGAAERGAGILRAETRVEKVEILDETQLRVYVAQGATAIPQVIRTLDTAALTITALTLHQPSLDDVFLDKTGRSLREPVRH